MQQENLEIFVFFSPFKSLESFAVLLKMLNISDNLAFISLKSHWS